MCQVNHGEVCPRHVVADGCHPVAEVVHLLAGMSPSACLLLALTTTLVGWSARHSLTTAARAGVAGRYGQVEGVVVAAVRTGRALHLGERRVRGGVVERTGSRSRRGAGAGP